MISTARKIKVCLVGAGAWGRQHARVFSQRPDVELCAVTGRTLAKTQARASEFGVRAYTNVSEMLAAEKPDLVSLSLPNLEHFEATMQVIEAGYPLLVALTQDQSKAILDNGHRKFSPGFHSSHSLWRSHCRFNFTCRLTVGQG